MIRLLTIEDYDGLLDMWIHTPGMGLRKLDDSREGLALFLKRNPTSCFVACEDGRLVGCIMGGHDGRRGYIYHTLVLPEYRHRGLGKALVDAVVQALLKENVTRVDLVVLGSNESGKKFWSSLGWENQTTVCFFGKGITDQDNGKVEIEK